MLLLGQIAAWSFLAFGALLLVAQLVAHEVGFLIGRRQAEQHDVPGEGIGVLVGGLLGLLAFVLALTLSFASERFNERRAGTLAEANAIGTAWLRAKAIGDPRGDEIARLLEQYIKLRIAFVQTGHDPAELTQITSRTDALQSEIWGSVSGIVRERPNPISASVMAALNEVFDMTTAGRFSFEQRLPPPIFWMLLGLTLLGMGVLGYQMGLRERRIRMLAAVLALSWTGVIVIILDLAAARIGNLRTGVAAYEWTLRGFQGQITVPALPKQ